MQIVWDPLSQTFPMAEFNLPHVTVILYRPLTQRLLFKRIRFC